MKSVCVYCGSSPGNRPEYAEGAHLLGRTLAERGLALVYGGGKVGLMGTVADAVLDRQDAALARLLARDFPGLVVRFTERALAAPRRPAPAVTPDFWHQVRLAEDLEAVRLVRPAAFRALPAPSSDTVASLDAADDPRARRR